MSERDFETMNAINRYTVVSTAVAIISLLSGTVIDPASLAYRITLIVGDVAAFAALILIAASSSFVATLTFHCRRDIRKMYCYNIGMSCLIYAAINLMFWTCGLAWWQVSAIIGAVGLVLCVIGWGI